MTDLPLFPLNTVLFPNMPLPLRIFEERYKEMLKFCLENNSPFGVVLIQSGRAEFGPLAEPYAIGCTAEILQVQPLADEQSFIMAMGIRRFRIKSLKQERPYLTAEVEFIPFTPEPEAKLERIANTLRPLVQEYLQHLEKLGELEIDLDLLPQDTEQLSYTAATVLQIPAEAKQRLLEEDKESRLMTILIQLYTHELSLMRTMPQEELAPFSLN